VRKAPPCTFPSDATRIPTLNNAVLKQPSLSHSAFHPESENHVVVDEDMTIVNETDPNIVQNDLSAELPLLQSRKRGAIEDHTVIDNADIVDKAAQISTDNGDQSQPRPPIQM